VPRPNGSEGTSAALGRALRLRGRVMERQGEIGRLCRWPSTCTGDTGSEGQLTCGRHRGGTKRGAHAPRRLPGRWRRRRSTARAAAIAALRTRNPRHAKVASAGVGRAVPVAVEGPRTVVFRGRARRAPSNPSLERRPPTAWRLGRGTAKAYHRFRGPSATPSGSPQLER